MINPSNVFISYAREDLEHYVALVRHLRFLESEGVIRPWSTHELVPGDVQSQVIDERLEAAHLILLLVSSDFAQSEHCFGVQMRRAIERGERGEACVIPIIVRACDWSNQPFARIPVLPQGGPAVASWTRTDEAWTNVAKGIRDALARKRGATRAPMSKESELAALNDSGRPKVSQYSTFSAPATPMFASAPRPALAARNVGRPALWISLALVLFGVLGVAVITVGLLFTPLEEPNLQAYDEETYEAANVPAAANDAPPANDMAPETCEDPSCGDSLEGVEPENRPKSKGKGIPRSPRRASTPMP